MDFRRLIISSFLIGLFGLCIIMFAVNFSVQNNTNVNLLSYSSINNTFNSINSTLSSSEQNATSSAQALSQESSNPVLTAVGFFFRSILNAGNTFINVGIGMFGTVFELIQENLGIPPIVTGTFMAIIVFILVFAAWRTYRAGE